MLEFLGKRVLLGTGLLMLQQESRTSMPQGSWKLSQWTLGGLAPAA